MSSIVLFRFDFDNWPVAFNAAVSSKAAKCHAAYKSSQRLKQIVGYFAHWWPSVSAPDSAGGAYIMEKQHSTTTIGVAMFICLLTFSKFQKACTAYCRRGTEYCFIIHQIFSLASDWSKCATWPIIPQLKLGNIREYFATEKRFPIGGERFITCPGLKLG